MPNLSQPSAKKAFMRHGAGQVGTGAVRGLDAEILAAALLENPTVAVFSKDLEGRYTLVNATCESLWETEASRILGRTDYEVLPERDAALVTANDRVVVETGETREFEESISFPSGCRIFLTSKMPLRDPSGRVVGLCGVATEITERKSAERQVQESEARFRAMADSAPMLVWMSDRNKQGTYFNRSWLEFTGRRLEQELGNGWLDSVHPEDLDALSACERALETRRPFTIEFRLRSADGGYRWVLDSGAPRFDADGEFLGFIGCCVDITERYEADRAKDEFLAVLGHELRNPLAPLNAGLDLLDQAQRRPELYESLRPMMRRQLSHLTRLVDDLIDLSRISRGKIDLQRSPLDLNDAISAAIEQTRPVFAGRRHDLQTALSLTCLPVYGDLERLTQVIANLLSNAARYTEPGGTITVQSEAAEAFSLVRVRDNGYGIPPGRTDEIFSLFSQIPEHRAITGGGGLGVGLSLSRQLVEMHGGSIEARSEGLGHGSEFIVRLPTSGESVAAMDERQVVDTASERRILIVDDNVDACEVMRLAFEFRGHEVQVAYDGKAALAAVEVFNPEVVLLDLGLPGMGGDEVARRIRLLPGGDGRLLICITGWGLDKDRLRTAEAGFDAHLIKPVSSKELLALIDGREQAQPKE